MREFAVVATARSVAVTTTVRPVVVHRLSQWSARVEWSAQPHALTRVVIAPSWQLKAVAGEVLGARWWVKSRATIERPAPSRRGGPPHGRVRCHVSKRIVARMTAGYYRGGVPSTVAGAALMAAISDAVRGTGNVVSRGVAGGARLARVPCRLPSPPIGGAKPATALRVPTPGLRRRYWRRHWSPRCDNPAKTTDGAGRGRVALTRFRRTGPRSGWSRSRFGAGAQVSR